MKIGYLPPFLNYFCTYLAGIIAIINNKLFLISIAIWGISILICYIETMIFILPHLLKNKRIPKYEKRNMLFKGIILDAPFIVSYASEYIYKEKKEALITNVSSIVCIIGYLFLLSQFRNF